MVSLVITPSSLGCIVRFQRDTWSDFLKRTYLDTDAIIIIDPIYEQDLRADFSLYQKLDVSTQMVLIKALRSEWYTGRRLSDVVLPAQPAMTALALEPETQQFALF